MGMIRAMRRCRLMGAVGAFSLLAGVIGAPKTSQAAEFAEFSGTGKGIVGGALLGGEIGFASLALFKARNGWLYATIPTALAIGGGIGGYFIEQNASPEIPLGMLVGSMVLAIPTLLLTLSATSNSANSEDATPADASTGTNSAITIKKTEGASTTTTKIDKNDKTSGAGGSDSSSTSGSKVRVRVSYAPKTTVNSAALLRRSFASGLINFDSDSSKLSLGVPSVRIARTYSIREMAQFGVQQRIEVHAPVMSVAF